MKILFSLLLSLALTPGVRGQAVIEASRTTKVTKDKVEVTLLDGKPYTGNITQAYANGTPKANVSLKNGIASGLWQEWYENGRLKFNAYWQEGKGHGAWEYYHENGVIRQEEYYLADIPVGIFREYYNNGQLKTRSTWLNGKKHGTWTYYSETGLLTKTEQYNDNQLTSSKQ